MSLDLSSLQLKDIKYLLAVYRLKSFREAANLCGVTQATISGQILKIERLLNLRLIERNSRYVVFTPVAEEIIDQFIKINEEIRILSEMAFNAQVVPQSSTEDAVGEFRIGVIPTVLPFFKEKIIPKLIKKYPYQFKLVEVTTDRIKGEIDYANIDFAICANHPLVGDLPQLPIGKDELLIVMNQDNPNANRKVVSTSLKDSQIFILDEKNCLRDHAINLCESHLPNSDEEILDLRYAASTLDTLKLIAQNNIGISILTALSTIDGIPKKTVACRLQSKPAREIITVFDPNTQNKPLFEKLTHEISNLYEKAYNKLGIKKNTYKVINNKVPECCQYKSLTVIDELNNSNK